MPGQSDRPPNAEAAATEGCADRVSREAKERAGRQNWSSEALSFDGQRAALFFVWEQAEAIPDGDKGLADFLAPGGVASQILVDYGAVVQGGLDEMERQILGFFLYTYRPGGRRSSVIPPTEKA